MDARRYGFRPVFDPTCDSTGTSCGDAAMLPAYWQPPKEKSRPERSGFFKSVRAGSARLEEYRAASNEHVEIFHFEHANVERTDGI